MYPLFDFHGLSYLFFSGWPYVFADNVPWDGGHLFFYEASEDFQKGISAPCRALFRHSLLYEL